MEAILGFFVGAILASSLGFMSSREDNVKAVIIRDKSFCVKSESSGVKFEKCYEVMEKR